MGEVVGNWDQKKDMENEKHDGMHEECCDDGRGNITNC